MGRSQSSCSYICACNIRKYKSSYSKRMEYNSIVPSFYGGLLPFSHDMQMLNVDKHLHQISTDHQPLDTSVSFLKSRIYFCKSPKKSTNLDFFPGFLWNGNRDEIQDPGSRIINAGCSSKWRWKLTTHKNEKMHFFTSKCQYDRCKKSKWSKRCALKNWTIWMLVVSLLIFNNTKNIKRSVLAFGCTAWICKIKSSARPLERLGPPNDAPCCEESRSHFRKIAAFKLETWDFEQWSCSLPFLFFSSRFWALDFRFFPRPVLIQSRKVKKI